LRLGKNNPLPVKITNARAKINLHLHITGRRINGYHCLDSLVAFTDLCDELIITDCSDFQLKTNVALDCPASDNLVTRATNIIANYFDLYPHVCIDLMKSIPAGAGLGGGSADAAATLLALRDYWNLNASDDLLKKLAAQLGSDIAACLSYAPVIMRDTGNTLYVAPKLPTLYSVLIVPTTSCPTQSVYKTYAEQNLPFSSEVEFPSEFIDVHSLCDFLRKHTHNDLTAAAIAVNPTVGDVLNTLQSSPDSLLVRLSGSGSGCYSVFENMDMAIKQASALKENHPEWYVKPIVING
jgi:4-diphosphocytidyl-2-C-methyl-D-erythritol kinase